MNATKFTKNGNYRFIMADGISSESVTYLGKNKAGMFRFLFAGGHVWTGHTPNVVEE